MTTAPSAARWATPTGESDIVSATQLISVTDSASTALGTFDFAAHGDKAVRVFLQGFG